MTNDRAKFAEKVFAYIRENQMLLPGERVVAGISGGADSVCLLFMLLEWKRQNGLELAVVHVNHGIRPEAEEDARFVEELCKKHGLKFYLREADIKKIAAEQKCSEEEAGRNFRYQAFRETADAFGAEKIAVAHNLNDRGETMLFHLFRGTGMKGLAGIRPVRDRIIRPLLCVERGEIEQYLKEIGQNYCRDATNEKDDYTRNRIRHHILSYAERELVPGCVRNMGRTAQLLEETEDYLAQQTILALEQCVEGGFSVDTTERESYTLDCETFAAYHPAIRKRMLYELAKRLSPGAKDISQVHVQDLYSLFERGGNRCICLPFHIFGRREYQRVILERGQQEGSPAAEESNTTEILTARELPAALVMVTREAPIEEIPLAAGYTADFQVLSVEDLPTNNEKSLIFPQNEYTKWFDYDRIKRSLVFRTRAEGDYLTIRDGQGAIRHKKLQDYMVTAKIPEKLRDKIPVLAEDSHVLWFVGYRISEYYKVRENTKQVLQVQLKIKDTEEKNGGTYQGIIV